MWLRPKEISKRKNIILIYQNKSRERLHGGIATGKSKKNIIITKNNNKYSKISGHTFLKSITKSTNVRTKKKYVINKKIV
jgi:hypothetical protein